VCLIVGPWENNERCEVREFPDIEITKNGIFNTALSKGGRCHGEHRMQLGQKRVSATPDRRNYTTRFGRPIVLGSIANAIK
jgi:hypothetical protein